MKAFFLLLVTLFTLGTAHAQGLGDATQMAPDAYAVPADPTEHVIDFETTKGSFRVKLYNDTPQHRDNFIRLVEENFYKDILFHRVISGFMIQAGDSASRHAVPGQRLGGSPEPYTIPAEIQFPTHYHKIGALAAARESDRVNPEKASSAWQFYIVTGRPYTDNMMQQIEDYLSQVPGGPIQHTDEQKEVYRNVGGAPHLDGNYTVFGELIGGFPTVDAIQWAECDENDRPLEDIRIIRATVIQ